MIQHFFHLVSAVSFEDSFFERSIQRRSFEEDGKFLTAKIFERELHERNPGSWKYVLLNLGGNFNPRGLILKLPVSFKINKLSELGHR